MTQPTPYTPVTDFSADEVANTGGRSTVRTAALDAELANIETTLDGVLVNLSLVQRDDGEIRDARVKLHTLSTEVKALLSAGQGLPRGAWVTATAYALRDLVTQGASTYICCVAHTSGVFATDLSAVKWLLFSLGDSVAAAGIPFSPTGTLAATDVQAAIAESDSENRALSASINVAIRADLASQADAAKGSALVGHIPAGAGAVATTVQAKIRQTVSVFDFMTAAQIADAQAGTLLLDCAAAFRAAIDSFPTTLDGNGYSYAGEVLIPPGKYRLDSKLTILRQVKLTGCGSPAGNAYGACQLHFADNIDGIVCFYQYAASPSNGSDGALLTGFSIINRGGGGGTLGSGVVMNARVNVQRVLVKGFRVDGFQVIADSSVAPGFNNANNWRMQDCSAVSNGRHGLYTDGGDANAGNCLGFDARSNGGWGIFDSSFLGNNYVGCHTAANTLGAYKADGVSARNVFIGCYSEGGQPASDIISPSIVVGGIHAAGFTSGTTAQMMVEGYQTSSVCYQNNNFNSATERQIVFAPPSALLSLKDPNELSGIYPFRLKGATGRFYWDWANTAMSLMEFLNSDATVVNGYARDVMARMPNGGISFPQGLMVGSGQTHISTGPITAPTSGTYKVSDLIVNDAPASAGYVGQVCTVKGTQGTLNGGATTGTMTAGSPTLTVNSATGLSTGVFVNVAGGPAITRARVISVVGLAVTLDTNAAANGAGVAVSYAGATFKTFGLIS